VLNRYDHKNVTWIDLERPTVEEVEALVEEFNLGPFVEQEILTPTSKPRIDLFPSFVYIVLHFPASQDTHGKFETHEVDLIVAKDVVITVHYESVPAIVDFASSFEAALLYKRSSSAAIHSGHILFELSTRLYQSVEDELDSIESSINTIESAIFSSKEKEMVKPISLLTREVLLHRRIIANQDEVLREFEKAGAALFGDHFKSYISSMSALQYRVSSRAQMQLEALTELRDTNNSLLTATQNEVTKNLTIMASLILPLSLVASIFGMNTIHNPIIGGPLDFWVIIVVMAFVGALTILYFKAKNWY
jgi:magnesium transporter